MQKCGDSSFCKRLCETPEDGYEVDPKSESVKGSELMATPRSLFVLKLTAYGGLARLHTDGMGASRCAIVLQSQKFVMGCRIGEALEDAEGAFQLPLGIS